MANTAALSLPTLHRTTMESRNNLVGYTLTARNIDPTFLASRRLSDNCIKACSKFIGLEWDYGTGPNPFRPGLWNALRRLVCRQCPPRRMPFNIISMDEFLRLALAPCSCGSEQGADGIVIDSLEEICTDQRKVTAMLLKLARMGKHVIGRKGSCLSCCDPEIQCVVPTRNISH